jgi:hypothetical protein
MPVDPNGSGIQTPPESESDVVESQKGGHPARSPAFRAQTGHVSERHAYYSKYYQKNKAAIRAKRKSRYNSSIAVRNYHKQKSNEWYANHKVKTGTSNRTIQTTSDGKRLYSIRHAASAIGFSVAYFRDLTNKGIIPAASYRTEAKWRLYTEGQIKLLKRAVPLYPNQSVINQAQAVLFCFWDDPETGLALTLNKCISVAIEKMQEKAKVKNSRQIQLKT